jgi:hypothetical protein
MAFGKQRHAAPTMAWNRWQRCNDVVTEREGVDFMQGRSRFIGILTPMNVTKLFTN